MFSFNSVKLTTISLIIFVAVIEELSRKESIVKEAARLFRVMGYTATSMRDLASAVGMEAASLYNHISSKQELLKVICMEVAEKHSKGLSEADVNGSSYVQKIELLIRNHIRVNTQLPERAAVAHDQWRHLDEVTRKKFLDKRNAYEKTLKDWIEKAIQAGEMENHHTEIVLFSLLSSLQWLHHWFRQERFIEPAAIEEEMLNMIFNGLKKR
jgi:AcrR family transcriptional regulator